MPRPSPAYDRRSTPPKPKYMPKNTAPTQRTNKRLQAKFEASQRKAQGGVDGSTAQTANARLQAKFEQARAADQAAGAGQGPLISREQNAAANHWNGIADQYKSQRSIQADASRWNAQAAAAPQSLRSRKASTARWTAMAGPAYPNIRRFLQAERLSIAREAGWLQTLMRWSPPLQPNQPPADTGGGGGYGEGGGGGGYTPVDNSRIPEWYNEMTNWIYKG